MLSGIPTWGLVAVFVAAAVLVAWAGARLSRLADAIIDRTGWQPALVGALFLGAATSLPEMVTTTTAMSLGNSDLAVGNLLGGVAGQMAILAVADGTMVGAISSQVQRRPVLLQLACLAGLLLLVLGSLAGPGPTLLGANPWSLAILIAYPLALLVLHRVPGPVEPRSGPGGPGRALVLQSLLAAAAILLAGAALVASADHLTARLDLDASWVGATAVAWSTSLPELSTTIAAARLGRPTLAFGNILGTNLLEVTILGAVDVLSPEGVLSRAGSDVAGLTVLGLVLVAICALGVFWRRKPVAARLGMDSWLVLAAYLGGMAWLALS